MLDKDTKRRIDTCRDILVGKVPDPKSQVEQITVALIYKFMDDMDLEAEELGGERKFFTQEYERYRWAKLVAPGVSGQEMLNTYSEALTKMVENDHLPPLFRSIFRNAYLPYRDPETLRSFLREIDSFTYDHSERLGDAFEYLLSVLGSQGDAGQFRTPRHIIDFMIEIIDPKKNEVILDPACGTAGFLISAYKHILKANSSFVVNGNGKHEEADAAEQALESPMRFPGDLLSPEDRSRLAGNIKGYDISPDMVRLSLVNLYLHGFADPKVDEYDTLTSEEKWTQTADVIFANPPFMSPKGGIRPHTRFQVQSKRSEVLFVDYIAEHLNPNGRAAIVVPEGIIFQSQSAYVALREMLVENNLAAVISLPAGVFNPYSGVKTSILILDRAVAKASKHVAFFKIENDGYQLGAQRRAQKGSQLTQVKAELSAWLQEARAGSGGELESNFGAVVERDRIADGGDYNLSGERYVVKEARSSSFPLRPFQDVCTLEYGKSLPQSARTDGPYPVMGSNGRSGFHNEYMVKGPGIVVGRKGSAGEVTWIDEDFFPIDTTYFVHIVDQNTTDMRYLFHVLRKLNLPDLRGGAGIPGLNRTDVYQNHRIPLPPLEVQREIVAEIEGYQRIIIGARAVVDNYRPHIPVDPEWPAVELAKISSFLSGGTPSKENEAFWNGNVPWVSAKDLKVEQISDALLHISERAIEESATQLAPVGAILVLVRGMGLANGVPFAEVMSPCAFNQDLKAIVPQPELVQPRFLAHYLRGQSKYFRKVMETAAHGTLKLNSESLKSMKISLPALEVQRAIVAEIEAEQTLVNSNLDLIARFETKINATIARVWGEAKGEEAA
ncbi:N-6 DNA methylase [Rhizobium johnstonii]|uniref:N-6 DNA methylase n=1 Tax=Rhizobium johnstonii TaxID=3019933 RepID=UPI003F9494C7